MSESFNYISFGSWEYLQERVGARLSMDRGRMFEYTPSDIEKRLEGFDQASIAYLQQLPTFLCSEIKQNNESTSMLVRYGRVKDIVADKREISFGFDAYIDFGEVHFTDIKQANEVIGVDRFQIYRTHWAVRVGPANDVFARLEKLHVKYKRAIDGFRELNRRAASAGEPPPRSKNIIGTARSVESFLKHLYARPAIKSTENFFRGHENSKYELTPSLLRKSPGGAWLYMPLEDRLCKELLISHYDEFQNDQYCFDRLVRMQHYRLPTRLLDMSTNPLVALFFACFGDGKIIKPAGEVVIFQIRSDKVKYYDSDTVSCLANLSNLTYDQKNDINLKLPEREFNDQDVSKKLLHHIRSEKGYFEGRIRPDDLGSIVCVKAKMTNTRIKSQSGAFLLFGHEVTLPETGQEGIEISRVKIQNKQHILEQLDSININATTVYPSIDQTAIHLRSKYRNIQIAPKVEPI